MMAPNPTEVPKLDVTFPIAFAHRGGNEIFPENTLEAFQAAYNLGYRYFETDVHYTAGNELIAFHDSDLKRTLKLSGHIADMTRSDREMRLIAHTYQVPLLEELLQTFPDVFFCIDAKSAKAIEPLVTTIKRLKAQRRVCLASFSTSRLKRIRALLPEAITVASQREITSLRFGLAANRSGKQHYLAIPRHVFYNRRRLALITPKAVARLHKRGSKIFVWTINDESEMAELLDMGVDGIYTDKLTILKRVLASRGQWQE